jgi:hypothetical protein
MQNPERKQISDIHNKAFCILKPVMRRLWDWGLNQIVTKMLLVDFLFIKIQTNVVNC